jgi:uncharacterized protein involved in response to NO
VTLTLVVLLVLLQLLAAVLMRRRQGRHLRAIALLLLLMPSEFAVHTNYERVSTVTASLCAVPACMLLAYVLM